MARDWKYNWNMLGVGTLKLWVGGGGGGGGGQSKNFTSSLAMKILNFQGQNIFSCLL